MPSAAALTITDKISDPTMTELDPSLLEFRPMNIDFGTGKDDPLNWTSQMLSDPMSIEFGRNAPEERRDDDDMNVEIELDFGEDDGPSIEIGRRERATRPIEDDLIGDDMKFQNADNLNVDFGDDDEPTRTRLSSLAPSLVGNEIPHNLDNEAMMLDNQDDFILPADDTIAPTDGVAAPADLRSQRDSESPLSSVHSSALRNFDATNLYEEEEASMHQEAHKAKKRRTIQADVDTVIPTAQIKQQQADRSAILKPASFLSRDPLLLNLMNMKRNGGFVSSVMGDGRAKGWAPELRGILSIEVVRKSGELKRKRDSGVGDVDGGGLQPGMGGMPQLEIPEDGDDVAWGVEGVGFGGDTTIREPSEIINLPTEDGFQPLIDYEDAPARQESDEEDVSPIRDQFDDTIAPLLHPMEQGAVSLGTQHAVHLLRDRFGSSADGSPSQQKKANILFQEMLPETTTSKVNATKMFFEVLVLATKDAVKVNQSESQLGGPIRIRGKRGLWGAWAEKEAEGEIAGQNAAPSVAVNA
jgi:cohesin complex subunit SCC1